MPEKARSWERSRVNFEQVKQNSQNTQQFVDLTEQYKTLGMQIEVKIGALFKIFATHFMSFDPNLPIQQDLDKSSQAAEIIKLLKKTMSLYKQLDFEKVIDATKHEEYVRTMPDAIKYYLVIATVDFEDPNHSIQSQCVFVSDNQAYKQLVEFSAFKKLTTMSELFGNTTKIIPIPSFSSSVKWVVDAYFELHKLVLEDEAMKGLKLAKTVFDGLLVEIDPYNIVQLKSALTKLKSQEDKIILEGWLDKITARDLFIKTTGELHDAYTAFLELDTRKGEKTEDSISNKILSFLSGVKAFVTNEKADDTLKMTEPATESPGLFRTVFNFFTTPSKAKPKKEVDEAEMQIDLYRSAEIVAQGHIKPKVIKTVPVESCEPQDRVHKEYQALMKVLIDAKKVTCFYNVMQATKVASSCFLRKPFEFAGSDNKLDCKLLDAKAKAGMAQCDFIFPFATASDHIISDFLEKSSKVEVDIYDDGKIGLKSHVDEVVEKLTIALGQAILDNYAALPAGSAQMIMEAEYQKPLDTTRAEQGILQIAGRDEVFSQETSDTLVQAKVLQIAD